MDSKLKTKLAILADAAKYDASCASSGGAKQNALASGGIGSVEGTGICHAYAPDGRCISLLKILLTNYCKFECAYCINRRSSNVRSGTSRSTDISGGSSTVPETVSTGPGVATPMPRKPSSQRP